MALAKGGKMRSAGRVRPIFSFVQVRFLLPALKIGETKLHQFFVFD